MRPRVDTSQHPRFGRGYTGHEHLCAHGLINMNGRLYDPHLQRFLSPDPYLQDPTDPQNHNAYSYCLNNPLMYTDPTGQKLLKKLFNETVHIATIVACASPFGPVGIVAATGMYASSYITGGDNCASRTAENYTNEVCNGLFDPTYYANRYETDDNGKAKGETFGFDNSIIGKTFWNKTIGESDSYSKFRAKFDFFKPKYQDKKKNEPKKD